LDINQILGWLSGDDQRSDGVSNQAVAFVLQNPNAFEDLYAGLSSAKAALRGRVADALEKIARQRPDLFVRHLSSLKGAARKDRASKVRFHLVMLIGHLACYAELVDEIMPTLLDALKDQSAFVKSWAIASLTGVARAYPRMPRQLLRRSPDCRVMRASPCGGGRARRWRW
jgi:hypothetical protein